MKKFLLCIAMLFMFTTVNASVKGNVNNIKIENIDIKVNETVGYNENVEISYSINPRDAKNLNLKWTIEGLRKGITATLDSKNTTTSDGQIILKVDNTLNKDVTLTLKATQNGKVISTKKILVETKEKTITRLNDEVNSLVNKLEEKITNKNYEESKENVETVEKILENNPEVKDSINKELLQKFENVKTSVDEYKPNNKTLVIAVTIALVLIFSSLIFWIFKKEAN